MSIAIVHLSDIHIQGPSAILESHFAGITAAFETSDTIVSHVIVLLSGDVAYSGKKEEFQVASVLLRTLVDRLSSLGNIQVSVFAVPGNHDCDLSADQEIRELIIDGKLKAPNDTLSERKLKVCLEPQANFFEFLTPFVSEKCSTSDYQAAPRNVVKVGSVTIGFVGLNTALFTKREEKKGSLLILNRALDAQHIPVCDILICAIHHPVDWLTFECMDRLKSFARAHVDFMFSGHEHRKDMFIKTGPEEFGTVFCEAGQFWSEKNTDRSIFSICLIDPSQERFKLRSFDWRGSGYKLSEDHPWSRVKGFKGRSGNRLPVTQKFRTFLNDPGAQYAHPRVENLRLGDFLVSPHLKALDRSTETESVAFPVDHGAIDRLFENQGMVLIFGLEKFGKTTLAKILFDQCFEKLKTPLYLDIKDLRSFDQSQKLQLIERAAKDCYGISSCDEFFQSDPAKRLLIIDNFGLATLTPDKQRELIDSLQTSFPTMVILGNEALKVELASGLSFLGDKAHVSKFELQELSYKQREELIRKWCTAGILIHSDDGNLERRIRQCVEIVETVLGKNLLPSTPFFVLAVLQLIEAETPVQTANAGSYGFIYEYLITQALARSNQIKDLDLKYNYLSDLAYGLFNDNVLSIDEADLRIFHSAYVTSKKIECDQGKLIGDFIASSIFQQSDGIYVIKYRYLFYYFVARYLATRFHDPEIKKLAFSYIDRLHNENYFNVLVFLVYLVKDPALKDAIIVGATKIFEGTEKFEFKQKNERIIALGKVVDDVQFEEGHVAIAQEKLYSAMSKQEPEGGINISSNSDKDMDELVQINKAFKAIQLLGQTVKNYVGSMDGAEKIRFVQTCYDLSLRTMSAAIDSLRYSVPALAEDTYKKLLNVSELRAARMRVLPVIRENEIYDNTREVVYRYAQMICMSVVKKVSFSIGSPDLAPVYEEVARAQSENLSYEIITTAIKLDHFRSAPVADLKRLSKAISQDPFIGGVVRRLVLLHFYLFPIRDSVRAEICHELDISYKKTHTLARNTKKSLPVVK
jgi:hypothetical protein